MLNGRRVFRVRPTKLGHDDIRGADRDRDIANWGFSYSSVGLFVWYMAKRRRIERSLGHSIMLVTYISGKHIYLLNF